MEIMEILGFNGEKMPKGLGHGIPKEIAKTADAEIRKKALNNETPKKPKTEEEFVYLMNKKKEEMVKNTEIMDAKTLEYHNLLVKPAIIVAKIPTKNYYPTAKEFNLFHDDFSFYRTPLNFFIKDDTLTVTNQTPNSHTLNIGMYSILEILASKFDAPFLENVDLKGGIKQLPDFEKIDAEIKKRSCDITDMFVDIYQYSDPRCISECYKYNELMAMPLFLRIQFLEWEKSLVAQKIINGILEGLKERDAQLEQIRKDYLSKYENEKTLHRTEFDKYNRATQNYKIVMEQLKARNDNLSQKLESVTTENSGYYPKFDSSNYYRVNIPFIKFILISFYYRFF